MRKQNLRPVKNSTPARRVRRRSKGEGGGGIGLLGLWADADGFPEVGRIFISAIYFFGGGGRPYSAGASLMTMKVPDAKGTWRPATEPAHSSIRGLGFIPQIRRCTFRGIRRENILASSLGFDDYSQSAVRPFFECFKGFPFLIPFFFLGGFHFHFQLGASLVDI